MSSPASKDHVSLCLFTFTDGRRCRTPRIASHPHFCFYHARKESQSQVNAKLAGELSAVFTRDYVSACDLSTVLGRLLVAVARGDIKPKAATTIASLARTLAQTIRLAQHEYINAFGTDGWRQAVCDSVNENFNHLNPGPDPDDGDADEPTDPESLDEAEVPDDPAEPEAPEADEVPDDPAASTSDETHQASPAESAGKAPEPKPAEPTKPPTPAEEALTVARNLFPRRRDTQPANSFQTNIYTTPRKC
jgi:hypothetical protein